MCRKGEERERKRENVSQIVRWCLFISIAYTVYCIMLVLSHIFAVNNHFGLCGRF